MEAQAAEKRCWELTADLVLAPGPHQPRKLFWNPPKVGVRTPEGNGKSGKGRGNQGEKG